MEKTAKKRIGCATVVRKGDKIALGKRGQEPNYGMWIIPGGGLKPTDKSLEECARREIGEELDIEIGLKEEIGTYRIDDKENNREIHYYWADYKSGILKAGDDLLEAKWCTRNEVKDMIGKGVITEICQRVLSDIGWAK